MTAIFVLIAAILGCFIGMITTRIWFLSRNDGTLVIDQREADSENYIFELSESLEKLPQKRTVCLRTKVIRKKNKAYNENIDTSLKGE